MKINFPPSDFVLKGWEQIPVPRLAKVRQRFNDAHIIDLEGHIRAEMRTKISQPERFCGKRICITGSSRGIAHIDRMMKAVIEELKAWGAKPFLIPAMGSHAGGTAEGQREMLASFGITEETMGVPILSSMETVQYSSLPDGTPLYVDRYAYESDGIVVMNKVKQHTNFHGKHESGLAKMMAIGLAKHEGASLFHMKGFDTFAERIPQVCEEFLRCCPTAFGIGIVENAYNEILEVEAIPTEKILERDAALLELAKENTAKFKYPRMDLILIDEMGKEISGCGYDPNVVSHEVLDYKKIFVKSLSEGTHHNACGIGNIDIVTRKYLNDVDWTVTWTNIATSTELFSGRIPMYVNTDREAVLVGLRCCNDVDFTRPSVVRIKNTHHMDEIWVSEAYWDHIRDREDVELLSEFEPIRFDEEGWMISE